MTLRITLLYLLISTTLFAQKKFEKGLIQFKDGRQENGYIEYQPKISTAILFKKTENDSPRTIKPNLVDHYTFENFGRKVYSEKISSYSYKENFSTKDIDKKIVSEVVHTTDHFLEILIEGKSNLLFLKDHENNKRRYFLKSEKSGLKELDIIDRTDNRVENNGQVTQFKVKRYIGILNLEFSDCKSITRKIKNVKLNQTSLSKIFSEYNSCTNSNNSSFKAEALTLKNIHKISIETGLYNSKIKPTGSDIRAKKLKNSSNLGFGINYIYTPTNLSSKTSLSIGLHYTKIDTQGDYYRIHKILQDKYVTTKINTAALNFRAGIIYSLSNTNNKLTPNIGLFAINSHLLNSSEAYIRVDPDGEQSYIYDDFGIPLRKMSFGFAVELGFDYLLSSKSDLTIKIGYEKVGDYVPGTIYPSNSVTFKLGYSFRLK